MIFICLCMFLFIIKNHILPTPRSFIYVCITCMDMTDILITDYIISLLLAKLHPVRFYQRVLISCMKFTYV